MKFWPVRPVYTDFDTAPMKWYHFLTKFLLFLGLLANGVQVFAAGSIFALLLCLGAVALNAIALLHLRDRKWTGVLALYAMYAVALFLDALAVIVSFGAGLPLTLEMAASIAADVAFLSVNAVYFGKRRLLFTPPPEGYGAERRTGRGGP